MAIQNKIYIPTINDNQADFEQLFKLMNLAISSNSDIIFDFSKCRFLRPNATAFLGGLCRFIIKQGHNASFDWATLSNAMLINLCQNGFANSFGYPSVRWDGNSVPYREDHKDDANAITDYLIHNWIGKGWVHVSDKLKNAIAGNVWEIYNNAFEHSNSEIGIFTCGQHFDKLNTLILSVIDFGCGIPYNVKQFCKDNLNLDDASCMKWAFGKGNSTTNAGVPRGLGLDLLKEFVLINNGQLEIYSNGGFAIINKNIEKYDNSKIAFQGTLVNITLKCNECLYKFKNEA